jgi:RNA polymerase sigma-70 factor, ECF subfamily
MNGPDRQTSGGPPGSKRIEGQLVHALASDDSLLGRCVAGDRSAWRQLHGTLQPTIVAFLRQMGVAAEDVDDVCQDVLLQIARYLPHFEHRSELKTWVYKICASQATRLRRKHTMRGALARMLAWITPTASPGPSATLTALDAQREMELALQRMSEKQRVVFVLFELHGMAGDEIARVVGSPPATVRGRLREARLLFAQSLCSGDERVP